MAKTKSVDAIEYEANLNVDSIRTTGMDECDVGDTVTLSVEGKVTLVREKEDYEKGKGLIYRIKISKVSKIGNKKQRPRVGFKNVQNK